MEVDPVHRRVMHRLMGLLGFDVAATAAVEDARVILIHEPIRHVLLGCRGPAELDRLLENLTLSEDVNLLVVAPKEVFPVRRPFTFIRRPLSWSELRRAIRTHEVVGM